ncbi:MAG: Asp-tRNA(Asn)/Glu-tRNA(Gln) amidotransferase subunit GatC [Planctomycetaceae bacterium]
MAMTEEQIRALARLARLELTGEEIRSIGPQLERILGFVEQLSSLDTDDVDPMTTALDVVNRWASDVPGGSITRDEALRNSPQSDEECFLVPPVLGAAGQ